MRFAVPLALAALSVSSFAQPAGAKDQVGVSLTAARSYIQQKQFAEAAELLTRAYGSEIASGVKPEIASALLAKLAEVEGLRENWEAQANVYARLVESWSESAGAESSIVVHYLLAEGKARRQAADFERGEAALNKAAALETNMHGATDPSVAYALEKLAELQTRAGEKDKAAETRRMMATPPLPAGRLKALEKGGAATRPRVVSQIEPEYSEPARLARLTGTVLLKLVVGTDGVPSNVSVVAPLGLGLDEKAIDAVKAWRFEPATKDGNPAAVIADVEVNFNLL